LINLLFQVNNNDYEEEITSKPYPKYVYKSTEKGLKTAEKEAFLKTINGFSSSYIYDENPLKKRGYCFFCLKKSQKRQKSSNYLFEKTLQLNAENLMEVKKKKEPKERRFRSKQTKE
jgi:hypothetical protein